MDALLFRVLHCVPSFPPKTKKDIEDNPRLNNYFDWEKDAEPLKNKVVIDALLNKYDKLQKAKEAVDVSRKIELFGSEEQNKKLNKLLTKIRSGIIGKDNRFDLYSKEIPLEYFDNGEVNITFYEDKYGTSGDVSAAIYDIARSIDRLSSPILFADAWGTIISEKEFRNRLKEIARYRGNSGVYSLFLNTNGFATIEGNHKNWDSIPADSLMVLFNDTPEEYMGILNNNDSEYSKIKKWNRK